MSIFNLADVQGKRGTNCTVYNTMEHYVVYFKTLADQIELPLCKKFDSAFRFKLESFIVWYEKLMSRHHQVFVDYERQSLMELKIGFEKFVYFSSLLHIIDREVGGQPDRLERLDLCLL